MRSRIFAEIFRCIADICITAVFAAIAYAVVYGPGIILGRWAADALGIEPWKGSFAGTVIVLAVCLVIMVWLFVKTENWEEDLD